MKEIMTLAELLREYLNNEEHYLEPTDQSDMICPTCGDPDCNRPWGHPLED